MNSDDLRRKLGMKVEGYVGESYTPDTVEALQKEMINALKGYETDVEALSTSNFDHPYGRGSGKTTYGISILNDMFYQTKPRSVLETSPMGENLHQLLKEADHPLTNTALDYIQELEEKVKSQEQEIKHRTNLHEEMEQRWIKAEQENKMLRNKKSNTTSHPAYRKK